MTVARMSEYNRGFAYEEQIGPRAIGRSVLEYLTARYRHSSAAEWARRLRAGEVHVDGVIAAATDRLHAGQRLVWHRPPWQEPSVPLGFAILHADADVLAVAKPRGLPTMPAGGFLTHTLHAVVRRRHPEAVPVHRLGRGTSGVVLFARSERARHRLPEAWQDGGVRRLYRALVAGRPAPGRFAIDLPIGPVPHPLLGSVHAVHPAGRRAQTTVRTLRASADASLVEVEIETGGVVATNARVDGTGSYRTRPAYPRGGADKGRAAPPGRGAEARRTTLSTHRTAAAGRGTIRRGRETRRAAGAAPWA